MERISNQIRKTHLFQCGDKFAVSQMANYLKQPNKIVQGNITTMMSSGEIVVATKSKRGTTYRKAGKNPFISMPWRKHSNEQIGITKQLFIGVQV